jgi:uncharacterized protein
MLLRKNISLEAVSLKMDSDTSGRFAGYASVFNVVDDHGDVILPGAFKKSLKKNGLPKMFLAHAPFAMFSSGAAGLPIGKYVRGEEDNHGLYVEGELTLDMSLAKDVHAAMRHETLDGLSIGGLVRKDSWKEKNGIREIHTWDELVEVSVVTFPANRSARVEAGSVKSFEPDFSAAIPELESIRDLERFLRDAGGLSKGDAVALVSRAKVLLVGEGDPDPQGAEAKALSEFALRASRLAVPA